MVIKSISEPVLHFINSVEYQELSKKILENTKFWLCDDIYEAEIKKCVTALDAAKITVDQIKATILNDYDDLKRFSINLNAARHTLELGQEYNPLEPPEPDDLDIEEYMGHSPIFLLENAIIFKILKESPAALEKYLKQMRIPKPKESANAFTHIFDNINTHSINNDTKSE